MDFSGRSPHGDHVVLNDGWDRVAGELLRRMEQRGLSKDRIPGVDRKTVLRALDGRPLRTDAASRLAVAVGWRPDAFERIRRGEEPVASGEEVDDRLSAVERDLAAVRLDVAEIRRAIEGLER